MTLSEWYAYLDCSMNCSKRTCTECHDLHNDIDGIYSCVENCVKEVLTENIQKFISYLGRITDKQIEITDEDFAKMLETNS